MIQATLGFATDQGERTGAWDEVYYTNHDEIGDAIAAWFNTSGILGLARTSATGRRLQCLSDQCYLYYVRFAKVGSRGISQTFTTKIVGYRSSENYAGDAAVFRTYGPNRAQHREIRLGGLPDNVVTDNTIDVSFVQSYIVARNAAGIVESTFFGKLRAIGGVIRYRTTEIGGPRSVEIASAAKPDQYGPITITAKQGITWATGAKVVLSCRGQPQLRGEWSVSSQPTSTQTVLTGSERVSCPPTLQGFLTEKLMDGAALTFFDTPYLSAHKLGKKKYQRRGRQSPKLLRH